MPFGKTTELIEPLVILPVQMPSRCASGRSPALNLMRAIIQDAVDCVSRRGAGGADGYEEAWAWLFDDDREWPFAFLNLCDWLGLDAGAFRRSLKAYRQQGRQSKPVPPM